MNIGFENKEEQKQILDILLTLGYKFHGEDELKTSQEIMNVWKGDYISVSTGYIKTRPWAIQLGHHLDKVWSTDHAEILSQLTNFKVQKPERIRIDEVGDHRATVTKENVEIYGLFIDHDTIGNIYKEFDKITEDYTGGDIHVTVADRGELSALFGIIYAMGWCYCDEALEEAINRFEPYKSIVIHSVDYGIGGNYNFNQGIDATELIFSKDATKIYTSLSNMKKSYLNLPNIGVYDVLLKKDSVSVGCQTITKEKVKEIVDAIDKVKH